jgi:hypothetical protein
MPGGGHLWDDGTWPTRLLYGGFRVDPPQPQPVRPACLKDIFGRCM